MTSAVRLATGPVSWGVDFAGVPGNPPWSTVLDGIAATGLRALELGPVGYLPEEAKTLRHELASRQLMAVGSFVFEDLHDPASHEQILTVSERACRAIAAAEGGVLVIIDRVGEERGTTFGRSRDARRLAESEWTAMLDCVDRVAQIAVSHRLTPAFHPHAGGFVEFEDEIERLLADTDLRLCLDTGHAALAGVDLPEVLAKYGDRLAHMHFKDVDGLVLERAREQRMSFWDALAAGIFCPIGDGVVDFVGVANQLSQTGYDGFATIEQDRVPGTGSPLEDVASSLAVLADAGFRDARSALDRAQSLRPAKHVGGHA